MRNEVSMANREMKGYLKNVAKAKVIKGIQSRREQQVVDSDNLSLNNSDHTTADHSHTTADHSHNAIDKNNVGLKRKAEPEIRRRFKQRKPI